MKHSARHTMNPPGDEPSRWSSGRSRGARHRLNGRLLSVLLSMPDARPISIARMVGQGRNAAGDFRPETPMPCRGSHRKDGTTGRLGLHVVGLMAWVGPLEVRIAIRPERQGGNPGRRSERLPKVA